MNDAKKSELLFSFHSPPFFFLSHSAESAPDACIAELIWIDKIAQGTIPKGGECEIVDEQECVVLAAVEKGSIQVSSERFHGVLTRGQSVLFTGEGSLTSLNDSACVIIVLRGPLTDTIVQSCTEENRFFCKSGLTDVNDVFSVFKQDTVSLSENSETAYRLLMRFREKAQDRPEQMGYPLLVDAAVGIMREEYAQIYGVEEVADRLGVSAAHLTRLFSKAVGMPPVRFLRKQKIEGAKKLLMQPDITVSIAAQLAGFLDSNYFSKVFYKETGMLPSVYRQTVAAAEEDDEVRAMIDTMYL